MQARKGEADTTPQEIEAMVREQIAAPNRSEPRMHTFHACQQHHMCPCAWMLQMPRCRC